MNVKITAILAFAMAQCLASADTSAETRRLSVNATGACQSALPVFDGQIRKRPLAVQNEGTKAAFITCSYYTVGPYGQYDVGIKDVTVFASTNDGRANTLTCTGVNGLAQGLDSGYVAYVPKTVNLPADGSYGYMNWQPIDFPTATDGTFPNEGFSISCNLNPGVGINNSDVFYDDDPA